MGILHFSPEAKGSFSTSHFTSVVPLHVVSVPFLLSLCKLVSWTSRPLSKAHILQKITLAPLTAAWEKSPSSLPSLQYSEGHLIRAHLFNSSSCLPTHAQNNYKASRKREETPLHGERALAMGPYHCLVVLASHHLTGIKAGSRNGTPTRVSGRQHSLDGTNSECNVQSWFCSRRDLF